MKTEQFWAHYSDRQILWAVEQYLFEEYGFSPDTVPHIPHDFLKRIYFATHVVELLIDSGWRNFQKTVWNTADFYDAIAYFNVGFAEEMRQRMQYDHPDEPDYVREHIVDNQDVVHRSIAEAARFHRAKLEPFIATWTPIVEAIARENDARSTERWKSEY